jgi:hypothetical protein
MHGYGSALEVDYRVTCYIVVYLCRPGMVDQIYVQDCVFTLLST